MSKISLTIRLSPEEFRVFKIWLAERGLSTQECLSWAIHLYLAGQLKPPPKG